MEQKNEVNSPEGALDELDAPGDEADASPASGRVEEDGNQPMKLQETSEHERERSRPKDEKDSPERVLDELDAPRDKADALTASEGVDDDAKQPKKLKNMLEHEHGRWKRRSQKYSPGRPGEEPDDPDGKTVMPGDDANTLDQDTGPGGLVGEQVESRGVEAVSGESGRSDTLYMDYRW